MISTETLRRFPLFGGLGSDTIKAIAMISDEVGYRQGEWLFREADPADTLFLVLDGSVELTVDLSLNGARGELSRLNTRTVGEIIGWSALVPPHRYTLGGRARSHTTVAQIDGPGLRELLDANPAAGYQLMNRLTQVVGERLVHMRTRFVSVTS